MSITKDKNKQNFKKQIQEMVHDDGHHISTKESNFYRQKIIEILNETYDTSKLKKIYLVTTKLKEKA